MNYTINVKYVPPYQIGKQLTSLVHDALDAYDAKR